MTEIAILWWMARATVVVGVAIAIFGVVTS
jgi:hypothetical protein